MTERRKNRRHAGLSAKLYPLVGGLSIALTVLLSIIAGLSSQQQIMAAQGNHLAGLAARVSDHIDQSLAERWLDVQTLSRSPTLTGPASAIRPELEALSATYSEFAWIGITDTDGRVIAATDGLLEGVDASARPWFFNAKSKPWLGDLHGAKLLEGHIHNPESSPLRFVDISAPVSDMRGKFSGVLGAHLFAGWVNKLITEFSYRMNEPLAKNIVILNTSHEVIFGNRALIGSTVRLDLPTPGPDRLFSGYLENNRIDNISGYTGFAYTRGLGEISGLDWTILVHAPLNELLRPVREVQIRLAISGMLIGLFFCAVGLWLARRVSAPMKALSSRVAGARYIDDLISLPEEPGFGEVSELSNTLRRMALRLREGENELARHRAADEQMRVQIRNLETTANTDELTGVLNRRAFEKILPAAIQTASPEQPVAIALLDLDHFKSINDQYGHAVGDEVLVTVSNVISGCVRGSDSFVRIGGEEFALIFPATDATTAVELIERIRKAVQAIEIIADTYAVIVSASFGVVMATSPEENPAALMVSADRALYAAKAAGRNCVRVSVPTAPT